MGDDEDGGDYGNYYDDDYDDDDGDNENELIGAVMMAI